MSVVFFADFKGRYSTDRSWLISAGSGMRGVFHEQIFGLYGFMDYQQTKPQARFWVVNPGIEWMSASWDAHVNGYFPTQNKKQRGPAVFGSDVGNYQGVRFIEHTQLDEFVAPFVAIS